MTKYFSIALLAVLFLAGCGEEGPDNPERVPPPTQEQVNAQIEKIKNDPNMTEEAKNAAIAGVQMRTKMNDGSGDAKGFGKGK